MIFGIILLAIAAILLVWFVAWFIITRVNGNCPLCAMEKIAHPSKLTIDTTDAPNYGGATVPPMGWSSWNTFRQNINQDLILEVAEAMEASGLAEAGYNYINLDDCWHSSVRDEMGRLQGDLGTFSMGIPALIKQLNSRGFKVGLYPLTGPSPARIYRPVWATNGWMPKPWPAGAANSSSMTFVITMY